jgi:RimJ/RimL family protein N-acetyltransferase
MSHLFIGKKLRLAAVQADDADTVQQWSTDATLLRRLQFMPVRPFDANEAHTSYMGGGHGPHHTHFRLRTLADNRLVGYVVLYDIYWNLQTANVGIAIGSAHDRGQGYGRDGLQLILRYAFNELNLHRVGLTVLARNTAARALYRSVGFSEEGIIRDSDYRDGVRDNDVMMGILVHEWRQHNPDYHRIHEGE